jgi:hypothetical protein
VSEQPPSAPRSPGEARPQVHLRDLKPGDRVKLVKGGSAEVVMNPRDGLWVLVRYVEAPPDAPDSAGEEELLYFEDVGAKL